MSIIAPAVRFMIEKRMPVDEIVRLVSEMEAQLVATARGAEKPKRASPIRGQQPDMLSDYPANAFEQWYRLYPHKVGRAQAEKAFEKVRKSGGASFKNLCDGVQRYIQTKPKDRDWCHPATWLNQGRWADQPAPLQRSTTWDDRRVL